MNPTDTPIPASAQDAPAPAPEVPVPPPALENDVPGHIRELRTSDAIRGLYDNTRKFSSVIDPDSFGAGPMALKAATELGEIFTDLGFDHDDARAFTRVVNEARRQPADAKQDVAWQIQAYNALKQKNGGDEAAIKNDLAVAQALVKRDPRFAALVEGAGIGNHPDVVRILVQCGFRQRLKGRV